MNLTVTPKPKGEAVKRERKEPCQRIMSGGRPCPNSAVFIEDRVPMCGRCVMRLWEQRGRCPIVPTYIASELDAAVLALTKEYRKS